MSEMVNKFPEKDEEVERECDYFASCLLMPEKEFIKQYNKYSGDILDYEHLSIYFGVTKARIGERVLQLKLDKYE